MAEFGSWKWASSEKFHAVKEQDLVGMKKLPLAWNLACNIYVHTKKLSCKSRREHPKRYNMAHISAQIVVQGRFFYSLHLQHVQRGSYTYLPYKTYWNVPGIIWCTLCSETSPLLPLHRRASRLGLRCDSYSCRRVFTSARLPRCSPWRHGLRHFPAAKCAFYSSLWGSLRTAATAAHFTLWCPLPAGRVSKRMVGVGGWESDGVCCKVMDGLQGHQETSYMTKNMDIFGTWGATRSTYPPNVEHQSCSWLRHASRSLSMSVRMCSSWRASLSPQSLVFARICSLNVLTAVRAAALLHLL